MTEQPPAAVSLAELAGAAGGTGAVWSLPGAGDLGAGLYLLGPGESVPGHVNREADLLIVGVTGSGTVRVEDRAVDLAPGVLVHLAKGRRREVTAGPGGVSFLTVHRRVATSRARRARREATDELAPP
ncbi:MAG TPA: hypothetical protein VFA11_14070 [Acidimicrobiales bacterium]|nr:hypothetical protein [Acidimicrobiales bacterium]